MFEHGNSGSAGFILNRPTELTLGKLVAADALLPEFADNLLYLGGDVGSDAMHFLHGCADTEVMPRYTEVVRLCMPAVKSTLLWGCFL